MEHAATLDLEDFEDAVFQDRQSDVNGRKRNDGFRVDVAESCRSIGLLHASKNREDGFPQPPAAPPVVSTGLHSELRRLEFSVVSLSTVPTVLSTVFGSSTIPSSQINQVSSRPWERYSPLRRNIGPGRMQVDQESRARHKGGMRRTTCFRRLIEAPAILMLPSVHDALGARIAEKVGFKAVTSGGYAASATLLGAPDTSQLSQTEMADYYSRLCGDGQGHHPNGGLNIAVTVLAVEPVGSEAFVHGTVAGKGPQVVLRVPAENTLSPGETVWASVAPNRIHVFDRSTGRRVEARV